MKKIILLVSIIYFNNCISIVGHQIVRSNTKHLPDKEITCGPNFFQVSFPKSKAFANQYPFFYFSDIMAGVVYSFATYWPMVGKIYLTLFAYGSLPLLYTAIFVGMDKGFYSVTDRRYSLWDYRDWAGTTKQNCREGDDYFYFSIVNDSFLSLDEFRVFKRNNQNSQFRQKLPKEIFLEKILQSSEELGRISVDYSIENFFYKEFASVKKEFCQTSEGNSYCLYSYYFSGGANEMEKKLLQLKNTNSSE